MNNLSNIQMSCNDKTTIFTGVAEGEISTALSSKYSYKVCFYCISFYSLMQSCCPRKLLGIFDSSVGSHLFEW